VLAGVEISLIGGAFYGFKVEETERELLPLMKSNKDKGWSSILEDVECEVVSLTLTHCLHLSDILLL
jgi:hypothetical protein